MGMENPFPSQPCTDRRCTRYAVQVAGYRRVPCNSAWRRTRSVSGDNVAGSIRYAACHLHLHGCNVPHHDLGKGGTRRKLLRSALLLATAGEFSSGVAAEAAAAPEGSSTKEEPQPGLLPQYLDDVMRPVNLHEFENVARTKISQPLYD